MRSLLAGRLETVLSMLAATLAEDEELRKFAASAARDAVMSVIVEVATPPISLRGGSGLSAVRQGMDASAAVERSRVGRENLQRVLAELGAAGLNREPTTISAAHSVVASVTPEQLRRLAELPGIAMIRRNRKVTVRAA